MGLYDKVVNVLSFNVLQTVLSKGLAFVNFAILIRLLSVEEIGIIGLSGGYIALLGFVMLLPESIFIRDFSKIRLRANDYISSFLGFGGIRNLVLFILALPVAWWVSQEQSTFTVGMYFILLVLSTLINSLSSPFREAFYANYRQARITFVDLSLNVVSFASLGLLYFSRDVLTYGFLQVLVALLGVGWWYWNAKQKMGFTFKLPGDWIKISYDSIRGFVFWNHLGGVINRLVYQADIVILSFFVSLAALGEYTIALTIANVFFVFPQLVQKLMSLSFSQIEKQSLSKNLGVAVRYNTLFSLAQFLGYWALGHYLIDFLHIKNAPLVFTYSLFLAGGVTLLNLARPWISLAVVRIEPKKFFTHLFLFPCALAMVIYWVAAQTSGVMGVAQANVLAYFIVGGWAVFYISLALGVRPDFFYLASFERKWLLRTIGKKK